MQEDGDYEYHTSPWISQLFLGEFHGIQDGGRQGSQWGARSSRPECGQASWVPRFL